MTEALTEEKRVEEPKLYPVQTPGMRTYGSEKAQICEPIYMAAYEVYSHVYAPQAAMVDHAAGCRGGFSTGELIAFLYARAFPKEQWQQRVNWCFNGNRMKNL